MNDRLTVGLISMPWMSASIPSIQLATLAATLQRVGIAAESYEFFLDYAATIGLNLYNMLSDAGGFTEEYIFARHYFSAETGDDLHEFRAHRPRFGLGSHAQEDAVLDALGPVTEDFLQRLVQSVAWDRFDVIGFTLTISQTAASIALARLIKQRHPSLPIVFGGSSCAGEMGPALMRICPYVDVVVSIEGELVFGELVRRLSHALPVDDLPGISWRADSGEVQSSTGLLLYEQKKESLPLNFDAYFARLAALGLAERVQPWIPFESSRGCWYGEKNQCNFCGLHEIMEYRSWTWESVLGELEAYAQRYHVPRFFSVDLIIPLSYYNSLLPEIARRGYDWSLFYEIKANVKKWQVAALADAGVRWIQPGIESLDDGILKLMRKGVSTMQNVLLLRMCAEHEIRVTWNIITGIPNEDPQAYPAMARRMRLLYHLFPPSGASQFQLHRFSPYFEQPEQFGLKVTGAHPLYKYIFPVEEADLNRLVYRFDFELERAERLEEYSKPVTDAIREWHAAHRRSAQLTLAADARGDAVIFDTRWSVDGRSYRLNRAEAALYAYLETPQTLGTLPRNFAQHAPEDAATLEAQGGVASVIAAWQTDGLVLIEGNQVLALAVDRHQSDSEKPLALTELASPVPYLSIHD